MVERLAGVRDERGRDRQRDAVGLDLEEDRAGDVPGGVAAGLEGGPDAARRERAGVRLALDEVLAGELGDRLAVAGRVQERVVLLGRGAGHRHEPVGVVGGAVRQRPLLHAVGDRVDDRRVERLVAVDRLAAACGRSAWPGTRAGRPRRRRTGRRCPRRRPRGSPGSGRPVCVGDRRDGGLSSGHGSPVSVPALLDSRTGRRGSHGRLPSTVRSGPGCDSAPGRPRTSLCIERQRAPIRMRARRSGPARDGRHAVRGPRRGGRAGARTRARRRRSDPSARRSPRRPSACQPGPDAPARPVERDRDPGDQQPEGEPDEALARVALGDEQRVLAEVAQADRQVRASSRDPRVAAARASVAAKFSAIGVAVGRPSPITRYGQRSARPPCRRASLRSSSCRPDVAAGDDEDAVRRAGGRVGHAAPARVPQRLAGRVAGRQVRRRPEPVLVERVAARSTAGR